LWQLLTGDVQLGTLEVQNGFVQLVKKGKSRNFDAFLKRFLRRKNKKKEITQILLMLLLQKY
jgi:hypothetical protein